MKGLLLLAVVLLAGPALAQVSRNQAVPSGAAGVAARLNAQGFKDIHGLRQLPDGQWVGKATQNGVERAVTMQPDGTTVAR